ncbi:MAG: hypothetical protein JWQ28_1681, partial [Pedobacter sp.]|nr:hypothetical protein [Pedobacter sp.]
MEVDVPTIKAGRSKITGRIISPNETNKDSIFVTIGVPMPISGEYAKYYVLVDRSGKFSIDVNAETDVSLIGLSSSLNPYKSLVIKLTNGGVTNIDVAYNSDFDIENLDVTPMGMTQNDMTRGMEVVYKMIAYRPDRVPEPLYAKSTDYFLNHAKNTILERLQILNSDTLISKELKGVLSKDFRLLLYNAHVFDYEGEMLL